MKSIVAVLSVLIGCSAAAQTVKPATQDTPISQPELIQIEQITASGFDTYSSSTTTAVAANSIPDAPNPMPLSASIRAVSVLKSRSADFKTFRSDNYNRLLVATEFWTRGLDALSTHQKLNDPCRCYREASRLFGLDMTPVLKSEVGAYSYSLGIATAYSFISAKLWNAGKEHPRHARLLQRLSRALLIGDSSMEITADIHNFSLINQRPSIK
jgi:hypothetical protein